VKPSTTALLVGAATLLAGLALFYALTRLLTLD
jgi:hypothetical protein